MAGSLSLSDLLFTVNILSLLDLPVRRVCDGFSHGRALSRLGKLRGKIPKGAAVGPPFSRLKLGFLS